MAATIGHIGPFVKGQEEWPQYAEQIEHFFKANGIVGEEKQLATFLSLIGPQTYKLLSSLVAPSKPGEKKYAEVVEKLKISLRSTAIGNHAMIPFSHQSKKERRGSGNVPGRVEVSCAEV